MSESIDPAPPSAEPAHAVERRGDGFRERGEQVTRTEAFVDAAFAFAVTLLIFVGEDSPIPRSLDQLYDTLRQIPAFAASFACVTLMWSAHHRWSRRYGLDDTGSVVRSLLLVFLVLIWVFPLRMMFGTAFMWLSSLVFPPDSPFRIPFTVDLGDHPGEGLRTMFIVYGVAWCSMCFLIAELYRHAWSRRDSLDLDRTERIGTRGEIAQWRYGVFVGVVSIAIAVTLDASGPTWLYSAPGMAYFLMSFTGLAGAVAERRTARALDAGSARSP